MKAIFLFLWISIFATIDVAGLDLEIVREKFRHAASDKAICREMLIELEKHQAKSKTHLAYLGAFQAVWAAHTANPAQKLNSFKKGKSHIEKAIKAEPNNIEIRFVRYTIQQKSPKFLGYHEDMVADKAFILAHLVDVESSLLKSMIHEIVD